MMNQIDRFVLICHFLWSAWVSIIIANHRSPHTLSLCFHLQGSGAWQYAGLSLLDVSAYICKHSLCLHTQNCTHNVSTEIILVSKLVMTGLADVDGFKICIQVCMWLGFRPLILGNSTITGTHECVGKCLFHCFSFNLVEVKESIVRNVMGVADVPPFALNDRDFIFTNILTYINIYLCHLA